MPYTSIKNSLSQSNFPLKKERKKDNLNNLSLNTLKGRVNHLREKGLIDNGYSNFHLMAMRKISEARYNQLVEVAKRKNRPSRYLAVAVSNELDGMRDQ